MSCVLCGRWFKKSSKQTWMREYRAIYTSGVNLFEAKLSGVGRYEGGGRKYLPAQSRGRYDDADFNENTQVEFRLRFRKGGPGQGDSPPRVWGFVFHAACWEIIRILFQPDVQLIFSLCFSMPIHLTKLLDWGHNYGGIVVGIPDDENPPHVDLHHTPPNTRADGDVFHRLPNELLQAILVELPRKDVRSLRQASPIFANLHLSESFWASRFWRGHEFHYVFETVRSGPDSWEKLYLALRYMEPRLADRKRIWSLVLELESLQNQVSGTVCNGDRLLTAFDTSKNGRVKKNEHTRGWRELDWCTAGINLCIEYDWFNVGCRPWFARILRCRPRLRVRHLWVSFVCMSGRSFVSGFRFVRPNGKVNSLGYIHPDQEVKICFSDGRHESPYTISGWQCAVENQGFRAVAVLAADGTMSRWAGEPDGVPRWRLRGPGKRISAIKAEFDALKLVSLSRDITENESITDERVDPEEYAWKPDIPPDHIFLNHPDDPVSHDITPYPLATVIFGGPRGEHLSQLTEIVIYTHCRNMYRIEFLYTDPSKNMFIGDPHGEIHMREPSKRSILIDGPGGERIVDAKMRNEGPLDDDLLLQTNHGREFLLGDSKSYYPGRQWGSVAHGSLVIGLFHIDRTPIIRIGIMSIELEGKGDQSEVKEAHEGD
ncbi:hypothetical protein CEP54_012435 [Fusarium duplospermum]|uniref:F-box domain-containing protein n=1 Tax=Fusarium duplospermum TaxID=1325734 RepID=A0A428P8P1_9HYPO|nr:hypothetical protein CEP54_012435 [Fusarium duplospermum]